MPVCRAAATRTKILTTLDGGTVVSCKHHDFAYNWFADEHQVGISAYFGPGQYSKLYPDIVATYGKYMIIGEATSPHRAWVVGSPERAVRGVYQFVRLHDEHNAQVRAAYRAYNKQ